MKFYHSFANAKHKNYLFGFHLKVYRLFFVHAEFQGFPSAMPSFKAITCKMNTLYLEWLSM